MVRHKNRWLLVMVELADGERNNKRQSSSSDSFPSRKEFTARLRRTVSWCFGITGEGAACDTQIRFCDADTRFVVVRVPREHYRIIWSSLTLLLTRKQLLSLGEKTDTGDYQASVVSVHGSARTAKVATFRKLRQLYRQKIEESRTVIPNDVKLQKNMCRALQERLVLVQNNLN
mmetsp:Transcript_16095/g.37313  ORF Transcript_16095/g.37313 Transcript_16095/m.37313 type:complete len:174 (-) Transcript_16095:131-652(-)|eukprot:CAMPEP_0197185124 /NCGR_PEP_ID=MMETSP1423-20130617/11209_1 /TAXON_ID=476441 /ORGANISM="Pseudo-nitzschia heimii, Strain UNC1101" /LENGTH=173 /DNA_ID=CAMNT_0042636097 /DNA_START=58 /DNA_END=579 /DNA_ORIENTATION=+